MHCSHMKKILNKATLYLHVPTVVETSGAGLLASLKLLIDGSTQSICHYIAILGPVISYLQVYQRLSATKTKTMAQACLLVKVCF
jgi:hypothetical protein